MPDTDEREARAERLVLTAAQTIAFFASAIKSGERWTDTCNASQHNAMVALSELRAALSALREREAEARTFVVVKNAVYMHGTFGPFASEIEAKTAAQEYANADIDDHHDWDVCVMTRDGLGEASASYHHAPAHRGTDWYDALEEDKQRSSRARSSENPRQ